MTLKQHQISKPIMYILPILVFVIVGTVNSAFAGTYSPNYANPTSCTGSSSACASVNSNGVNKAVTKSTGSFTLKEADAYNNLNLPSGNQVPGSNPSKTINSPIQVSIVFSSTYSAKGYQNIPFGSTGGYEYRLQAWRNTDSTGWQKIGTAIVAQHNSLNGEQQIGPATISVTKQSFAGNTEYRASTHHHVWTWNNAYSGTSTSDYWNSPTRHVTTNNICIDTTCN